MVFENNKKEEEEKDLQILAPPPCIVTKGKICDCKRTETEALKVFFFNWLIRFALVLFAMIPKEWFFFLIHLFVCDAYNKFYSRKTFSPTSAAPPNIFFEADYAPKKIKKKYCVGDEVYRSDVSNRLFMFLLQLNTFPQ